MILDSICLPSEALSQCLLSNLGFSYLGRGVSLHGCSSKAQPLLLSLDEGYLLTTAPPDLERGIAPLGPLAPTETLLFGRGVAPLGRCLLGVGSSWLLPLTSDMGRLLSGSVLCTLSQPPDLPLEKPICRSGSNN